MRLQKKKISFQLQLLGITHEVPSLSADFLKMLLQPSSLFPEASPCESQIISRWDGLNSVVPACIQQRNQLSEFMSTHQSSFSLFSNWKIIKITFVNLPSWAFGSLLYRLGAQPEGFQELLLFDKSEVQPQHFFPQHQICESKSVYALPYVKQITNKDLVYSTGNSIQYSVMAYMGKESKKEWIYVYV